MRIAYFDCSAGVSGPLILGALLDAGLSLEALQADLAPLRLPVEIQAERVRRGTIQGTKISLLVKSESGGQMLPAILTRLEQASLPEGVAHDARRIFQRLAEAEAKGRGVPPDQVSVSDWGGLRSVAEIVGAVAGLHRLDIAQVSVSPLLVGYGLAGSSPTAAALLVGSPVRGVASEAETVTPVGAAILTTLASAIGPLPAMTVERIAYGASDEGPPFPHVLPLWLGQGAARGLEVRTLLLLETNIDDMNPEFYDYVMSRLFAAGALDVTLLPMQMKKNRPATLLRVLCSPDRLDALRDILLRETTTLGVRVQEVQRFALPRRSIQVETPWGIVRVKVAELADGLARSLPEHEDCRRLAEASGVPLWQVYRTAQSLAEQQKG